jgi:hypothetical protein
MKSERGPLRRHFVTPKVAQVPMTLGNAAAAALGLVAAALARQNTIAAKIRRAIQDLHIDSADPILPVPAQAQLAPDEKDMGGARYKGRLIPEKPAHWFRLRDRLNAV